MIIETEKDMDFIDETSLNVSTAILRIIVTTCCHFLWSLKKLKKLKITGDRSFNNIIISMDPTNERFSNVRTALEMCFVGHIVDV